MVRNVLEVVYKEVRGLHQAAYILAVFTLGSQLLALVRDRLLAGQFGDNFSYSFKHSLDGGYWAGSLAQPALADCSAGCLTGYGSLAALPA